MARLRDRESDYDAAVIRYKRSGTVADHEKMWIAFEAWEKAAREETRPSD